MTPATPSTAEDAVLAAWNISYPIPGGEDFWLRAAAKHHALADAYWQLMQETGPNSVASSKAVRCALVDAYACRRADAERAEREAAAEQKSRGELSP